MNVNNHILMFIMLISFSSFSQIDKDVYFILKDNDPEYVIHNLTSNEDVLFINLLDIERDEYKRDLKRVEEAKKSGAYYYSPESGRDNITSNVPKLTFEVISNKKKQISADELSHLNLVDYNWIKKNSWKKAADISHDFKSIYFLCQTNTDSYIFYEVKVSILEF